MSASVSKSKMARRYGEEFKRQAVELIVLGGKSQRGWKLGESLSAELVGSALQNALALRQPQAGLYFHSDRGCQ